MKKFPILSLVLLIAVFSSGLFAQPAIVKDINSGAANMDPLLCTTNGNYVLFYSDASGYRNIYRSDGTESGTNSVAPCQGYYYGKVYGPYNNNYYYSYQNDVYKLSSSFASTRLKSFNTPWGPRDYSYAGNTVFFISQLEWKSPDFYTDNQLWKTDGTARGTQLIKDIYPGAADFIRGLLTPFGNNVFFWAKNATAGIELWKSDGTSNGTVMVKDINPGTANSYLEWQNSSVEGNLRTMFHLETYKLVHNGKFYFSATDGTNGTEIWEYDGTNDPVRRTNINTSGDSHPYGFCVLGNYLFFGAKDNNNDFELYKLDISVNNSTPVLVKNINPATTGTVKQKSSFPIWLTNFNNKIYFSAYHPDSGRELWETDGTESGTVLVKDIYSGTNSSTPNDTSEYQIRTKGFFVYNNYMYFMADDGVDGQELWKSNGTSDGTVQVANINSGSTGSFPRDFLVLNGTIYFSAATSTSGRELWKYTPGNGKLSFGTEDLTFESGKLMIYPNPVTDYLILRYDIGEASDVQISIDDVMGNSIQKIDLGKTSIINQNISFENIPSGIYFITVKFRNEILRGNIIRR